MTAAELAGGYAPAASDDLPSLLTQEYQRRIAELGAPTQLLMLLAVAEPLGDAALLWRAAERVSVKPSALTPASEAGLLEVDDHVVHHRSCERLCIEPPHPRNGIALIVPSPEASDPYQSADGRAWHRALASVEPDEAVAVDLERSAERAVRRGGLAAAAALLDRASVLTPDARLQAGRALAAAAVSFQAGDLSAAQRLLATAMSGELDGLQRARAALLRGHVAVVSRYGNDASGLLLEAARQLEPFDLTLARRAYLTAWGARP